MSKSNTGEYGWTAVPRNRSIIPSANDCNTAAVDIDFDAIWPNTEIVRKASEWVKVRLPKETCDHSLRVYYYGTFPIRHPNEGSPHTIIFSSNTPDRPYNPHPTSPHLALNPINQHPILGNLGPYLPLPRHSHHALYALRHTPLLRIPRRLHCTPAAASAWCAASASRERV